MLKEVSLGCSLEGIMLKLKFQYFGHLMWRVDSLEKTLMLGGIGGRRRKGQQRMRCLDGITDFEWTPGDGDWQGGLACCNSWGRRESDTTEWLNWTEQCRHRFDFWVGQIPWRRKWQSIPVFLPGEPHGQKSLMGYSPWSLQRVGPKLTTEHTHTQYIAK